MASNAYNRSLVARAAAILTASEVAATRLDVNEARGTALNVQVDFTLGSLTNVVIKFYVSMDGTNWYEYRAGTGASITQTLTANTVMSVPIDATGWKFFRASAQGTGTVAGSSCALTYRYVRRGVV